MCSRKILSVRFFLLFFVSLRCFAQSNYPEIEIYRSLVDKETRDSSYHKALAEYHALPTPVMPATSSNLQKRLVTILSLPENTDPEVIQKTEALEALSQDAAQKRNPDTELSALTEAFIIAFWHEPKNYSKAFVLAVKLKKRLAEVNDTQFPGRRNAYVKLGQAYYIFKDYAKSIEFSLLFMKFINEMSRRKLITNHL